MKPWYDILLMGINIAACLFLTNGLFKTPWKPFIIIGKFVKLLFASLFKK